MNDAEEALLQTFIAQCRAARDPQAPSNNPEVAAAAVKWELKFTKRVEQLKKQQAQHED